MKMRASPLDPAVPLSFVFLARGFCANLSLWNLYVPPDSVHGRVRRATWRVRRSEDADFDCRGLSARPPCNARRPSSLWFWLLSLLAHVIWP